MLELKSKKYLGILFVLICFMCINPFEQKTFTKNFEGKKNITTHIKEKGNKNIIIFKELQKDKYYFSNLEQYLLAQGIFKIDELYMNYEEKDIQNKFSKVDVKLVLNDTHKSNF